MDKVLKSFAFNEYCFKRHFFAMQYTIVLTSAYSVSDMTVFLSVFLFVDFVVKRIYLVSIFPMDFELHKKLDKNIFTKSETIEYKYEKTSYSS